MGTGLSVA